MDEQQQVETVIRILQGRRFTRESKTFQTALQWIAYFPQKIPVPKKKVLIDTVCASFDISEPEIYAAISGLALPAPRIVETDGEATLAACLPKGGWLEWYTEYTKRTESPLSYHIFSSLCVLGAALGRRVYKPKGFFNIYPNYCVVLVGPPARVAKTSAVNIAAGFIERAVLCPIMADKATPEAIVAALRESGGHQFIYAPELSVFLGKQNYNEGLTALMLRLLDCPDRIKVRTLARGEEVVECGIALTVLGASTMSLLANATPDQVTSSGFLSRFLLVIENDSEREFPEPERGPACLQEKLCATLARLKAYTGEVEYAATALAWFTEWYHARKKRMREITEDSMAEAMSRYAVHLERTAMLVHLAEHDDLRVCEQCFRVADSLLGYIERKMPQAITAIDRVVRTQDADYILDVLRRLGGAADHSKLLRRVSSRMDAATFRRHMNTLTEAHIVREERRQAMRFYIIEGDA